MRNIPNLITLFRIFLTPFIPICYFYLENKSWTLLVVLLATVSDFLDGFIARKYSLQSKLGTVLDPLADKIFLLSVLVTLYLSEQIPWQLLLAYVLIEITMILIGAILFLKSKRVVIPANYFGKVATALFFFSAAYAVSFGSDGFILTMFYLTIAMKVIALISYIIYYKRKHTSTN